MSSDAYVAGMLALRGQKRYRLILVVLAGIGNGFLRKAVILRLILLHDTHII